MSIHASSRRALVSVIAAFGLLVAACSGSDDTSSSTAPTIDVTTTEEAAETTTGPATTEVTVTSTSPPTTAAPTTDVATTVTPTSVSPTSVADTTTLPDEPVEVTLANVYWATTVVNPAAGTPERIGAGAREVVAATPVRGALEALLAGPDPLETSIGMTTNIPAGTRVLGIAVDGSTATVDLSGEFAEPGGTLGETMRLAQVVFTVTQFDGVERVWFHLDGVPADPVLSEGFEVGDGFTRDSFVEVRPRLLVEQPFVGETVTDPIVIRGESNTFEANVRFAVTGSGGDGVVLTEGFTTATNGNGVWGTFEIVVPLADLAAEYEAGPGAVMVWEDSPRDGSRTDVVEVPIVLPER